MTNTLNALFNELELKPYRIADKANVTRNTIYRLVKGKEIPATTKLVTLRKIAKAMGYRVEIIFSPEQEQT